MINKKKLALIVGFIIAVVLALVLVIVLTATAGTTARISKPHESTAAPSASASSTPGSGATEGSYADVEAFTEQLAEHARSAASAANAWSKAAPAQNRVNQYLRSHISPETASTFTPVWAEIFASAKTAEVTTSLVGDPAISSVTGTTGHHTFIVGVPVNYQATWLRQDGTTGYQAPTRATWWVTVDEASGLITAITQPSPDDLQIRIGGADQ